METVNDGFLQILRSTNRKKSSLMLLKPRRKTNRQKWIHRSGTNRQTPHLQLDVDPSVGPFDQVDVGGEGGHGGLAHLEEEGKEEEEEEEEGGTEVWRTSNWM